MIAVPLKVLILEDQPTDAELMRRAIEREGLAPVTIRVETEFDFRKALNQFDPEVILSDFSMPNFNGLKALEIAHATCPDTPFIFVSGTLGDERAVQTLRQGASDYVLKDNLTRLGAAVRRALEDYAERRSHRDTERELEHAERRFRLFMQYLPGIASIKDLQGSYRFVNHAWAEFAGVESDAAIGKTDHEIWPSELARKIIESDRHVQISRQALQSTECFSRNGLTHHWLLTRFPIMDESGQSIMVGTIGVDVSGQKNQELKIARLTRIHTVLSGINSTIVRVHERARLANESCRIAVEFGGFQLAWIGLFEGDKLRPQYGYGTMPDALERISHAEPRGIDRADFGLAFEKGPVICNDVENCPPGLYATEVPRRLGFRSSALLPLVVDEVPVGLFALYGDEAGVFDEEEVKLLSELAGDISFALSYIGKEERLNSLAYYDVLTGLPNRTLFKDRLCQSIHAARQEGSRVAVLLLDVPNFRRINDSYGRAAGDQLLQRLGRRLQEGVHNANTIARLEADTFALTFGAIHETDDIAHIIAEQVFDLMHQPIQIHGDNLLLALRAGIAIYPNDGGDVDTLLRNADTALRRCHETGEPYLFYAPELHARATRSLALENKLRHALKARQFEFYYQPKVDLASNRVASLEALIRWRDPDNGLVLPAEFISLLETSGLIIEVGRSLFAQAIEDYRGWIEAGCAPVPVAINVSTLQLRQRDFVDQIERFLATAQDLQFDLEITESVFMQDIEESSRKLAAVKELGIGKVAIDDFGTGYSSLAYLSRLPVDALKIDRSFIVDMAQNANSLTMVSTIISLGHSLNMTIIAEGVESAEQAHLLKLLRCDEIQGELFSAPLPRTEIAALLRGEGSQRNSV
ncbi:MAG: EAL domain-containing protein [Burkholderiales bacterium]|nr:EAL domain-containing protein [Burkholderiales bacterium]